MLPSDEHPADDTLETYAIGRLGGAELEFVEEHLLVCELCRRRLQDIEAFVRAIREAAAEGFEPIRFVHQTETGPVYLEISRAGETWQAHLWGVELELQRSFSDPRQALRFLVRAFAELFPGHRCSKFCRR